MSVQLTKGIQPVNGKATTQRPFNASSTHQTLEEKAVTSLKNEPLSREELRQYMSDFYRNFLRQHLR
ncbi:MAG: hypothetical protein M1530_04525, partial [Candidatus Marsarchaeota archaeon]|nr:hypothetical protein [Candidatus Marsarchaeota archaeon]